MASAQAPGLFPFLSPLSRYAQHSLSGFRPRLMAGLTQAKRPVSAAAHSQTIIWPHPGEPDRLAPPLACLPVMPPPPTKPPQGRHSPPTAPPPLKSRPHIDTHVVLKVFQAGVGGTPVRSDGRMGTGLCVGMDIRKMGPAPYSAHSCQFPGAYQADRDKHHLTLCPWVSLPAGASGKVHRHTELAIAGSSSGQQMLRWKGRKGEFIGGTSMKEKGAGLGRGHREARQTPTTLPSEGLQT